MSVGAWEPAQAANDQQDQAALDVHQLQRLIDAATAAPGQPLSEALEEQDLQASALIRLPAQRWIEESANWDSEALWGLIRFFTLAEQQLSGWDAGADSAVIPIAKALRERGDRLSRERLLWIREHSDNRYLPYGPL